MEEHILDGVPPVEGTEQAVEPAEAPLEETPVVEEEKETPVEPASTETPDSEKEVLKKQVQGLLNEIKVLRGKNRQLTPQEQQTLVVTQQKVDDLQDVNPEDVKVIDKILHSKGYLTKTEAEEMTYKAVQKDELDKFLEKFPEYKPENDPNDLNWTQLQREISLYARPKDARQWTEILDRAHKSIVRPNSDRSLSEKKQQVKTAQVGSGGTQKTPSKQTNSFDAVTVMRLKDGGFSDEDIKKMESKRS